MNIPFPSDAGLLSALLFGMSASLPAGAAAPQVRTQAPSHAPGHTAYLVENGSRRPLL